MKRLGVNTANPQGDTGRAGLACATALTLILGAVPFGAQAESLSDAITQAYQQNPTIGRQRALQRATSENFVQARSAMGPSLSVSGSTNYSNRNQIAPIKPGLRSTSSLDLNLSQRLYASGEMHHNLSAARASVLASEAGLRSVEQGILFRVVSVYTAVIRDQEALRISKESVDFFQKQLEETRARFQVGELTRTDVAQSEASLAQAQSQSAQSQAQLDSDRADYIGLVGQRPLRLEPAPLLTLPKSYEDALSLAEANNPDLLSAQFEEDAAHERIKSAKSAYGPDVRLNAVYGGSGPTQNFGKAPGTNLTGAQATVTVSVPLFSAGLLTSQVRQATENATASALNVDETHRLVITNLSQAWSNLAAAKLATQAREAQVKSSGIAAEGSRIEHQAGLRTTIEVLNDALTFENAQLNLLEARRNEFLAASQILVQTGQLEPETFGSNQPAYDPELSFAKVSGQSGLHPVESVVGAIDGLGSSPVHKSKTPTRKKQ